MRKKHKRYTAKQKTEFQDLILAGNSARVASERTGINRNTAAVMAAQIRKAHGITARNGPMPKPKSRPKSRPAHVSTDLHTSTPILERLDHVISSLDTLTEAVTRIGTRPTRVSVNGSPDTMAARADAERHLQAHHQREREREQREILESWGDYDDYDDF